MQSKQVTKGRYFQAGSYVSATKDNEYFMFIQSPSIASFADQVARIEQEYADALKELGIPTDSAVYRRFFISDATNQIDDLKKSDLYTGQDVGGKVAVSVIQQAPLGPGKIALFAYHVTSPGGIEKINSCSQSLLLKRPSISQLWFTNLYQAVELDNSYDQTTVMFDRLIHQLNQHGGTLADNTIRTWLCVRDVDRNYKGMVDRRREMFKDNGLTADTHYIASTGIEGSCADVRTLVSLDALSLIGVDAKQIEYLNAYDHLCDTIDYNVTFERATKVSYRDRGHIYISGTASIDKHGNVLHEGDVLNQAKRMMENVKVLLADGGAKIDDMMYMFVYLRDLHDKNVIDEYFQANYPNIPYILLHAPVCRPQWLIEVEGIAAFPQDNPDLKAF